MSGTAKLLVVKRNKKALPYPTYRDFVCDNMSSVAALSTGGSIFLYGGVGKTVISSIFEVEATLSQIKQMCNHCCYSTSA